MRSWCAWNQGRCNGAILQQILETQHTILKELRQQNKDIIQVKEKQKHIEQNPTESIAKQSNKLLQSQVFVEKISNVVCAGKAKTRNPPLKFQKIISEGRLR